MKTQRFDSSLEDGPEHGFWYRLSSSAVLVGAGIGWTSAVIACCVAAPISLAFGRRADRYARAHDDL